VITAATLELAGRPAERATALLVPAGLMSEVARSVERSLGTALGALELVSGEALRLTVEHVDEVADPFPGQHPELVLLVEADGVAAREELLGALDRLGGLLGDAVVLPPDRAWALRHGVTEALARAGEVLGLDVSVPRSALEETRAAAADVVRRTLPGARLADFGHVGDGGVHLNVVLPAGHDPAAALRLRHEIYALVAARGGSFSAEHGLGPANLSWWRDQLPAGSLEVTRAVKRALDPYGLLGTDALRTALTGGE
jgi:FAD/FMN-containing dehydrogenase